MTGLFSNQRKDVFGLDIGYETLKLCEAHRHGNKVHVVGFSEQPITERILDRDRIKNKAATANLIKEARSKAKPHEIKARGIVTSLPETFVFSKTIQVPKMSDAELRTAVPNEAAQYLPIPLSEVYVDYQILITHPDEALIDVLVAAAPKRLVDDYVEMAKMADLELVALETKPIAVGRAIIPEKSQTGILIAHIGTELTRISIWDKGSIRLVTTSPIGKNQIFEALTASDATVKDFAKAKLEKGKYPVLEEQLGKLTDEIIEGIRYHQNRSFKPSPVTEIEICGTGALLSGIEKFFEDKTKIKSKIATPKYNTNEKVDPNFMTSFGLALREF